MSLLLIQYCISVIEGPYKGSNPVSEKRDQVHALRDLN